MTNRVSLRGGAAWVAVLMFAASGAAATPDWRLPDLSGTPVGPADYPGDWVVVNYWATWCKPCLEEMPELNALAAAGGNLVVLGVAWEDTSVENLEGFMEKVSVDYPVLRVDPFEPPAALEAPRVLPTTVVYGPGGEEMERFHGPVTRADIERVTEDKGGQQ